VTDRRCKPEDLDETGQAVKNNIQMLRTQQGWTREGLAGRLDERGWPISERVIKRIELGYRHVNVDELAIFARIFRVDAVGMLQPMRLPSGSRSLAAMAGNRR
jgi:ribosome-binding protein aMBF1 (putative translation factor)